MLPTVLREQRRCSWSTLTMVDACHAVAQMRHLAAASASVEEFAQRAMMALHSLFGAAHGTGSEIVLARCFVTRSAGALGPRDREYASAAVEGGIDDQTLCLVLAGSAGEEGRWNDPQRSTRYRAIPITAPQFATQFPMFSEVFRQIGLVVKKEHGRSVLEMRVPGTGCNVFTVPVAKGSPYVPRQADFVERYGVTSVIGCGGMSHEGEYFVTVLFLRTPISQDAVQLFRLFALALQLGFVTIHERTIVSGSTSHAAVVEELLGLYQETIGLQVRSLQHKEAQLHHLAERLIAAEEEERARIARELHDHVVSGLAGIGFGLQAVVHVPPHTKEEMLDTLRGFVSEIETLVASTRNLAFHLHPVVLDRVGITAALNRLLDDVERRKTLQVIRHIEELPRPLAPMVAAALYRIAEEALQNIIKHAGIQECRVSLVVHEGVVDLCVQDSGRGFPAHHYHAGGSGLGLLSITERTRQIGGQITIDSAPGKGTLIRVRVPLPATEGMESCHGAYHTL